MIEYRKRIVRADLVAERDKLFVFGDNLARQGMGGQAREMRGEPNAVGIPTKISPSMSPWAFFTDADFDRATRVMRAEFVRLQTHAGGIVWPADGIGTGLAQLPARAPAIWNYLEMLRRSLIR